MVTLNDNTLRTNVYNTVYTQLNSDRLSYSTSPIPTLYGGYPDLSTITFPAIILSPIKIINSDKTVDETHSSSKRTIIVSLAIFSTKNRDLDILSDSIDLSMSNQFSGMVLTDSGEGDGDLVTPNDQKVHIKTLTYTFIRRS